ncbi:MAG: hypothetical protein Tsb004_09350 [Allomuricauda sp.]
MKSKLNIWLLVSFLVAGILTLWLYKKFTNHVGDITYNSAIDSPGFNVCGEFRALQYYQTGTYYQGGKKAIKKQLWSKVSADGLPPNGLLTVRFVVNCHGETGLFRANMTDPHVRRIEVPQETSKHFGDLISELKGWVPGKIQGKPLDSYIQIVFKVENGIITDIF